ncbi:thiamine pyrophosphate-dependent acetolactate synthase large subunit-like protein [Bradyrhizobium sp. AZCC 2230]
MRHEEAGAFAAQAEAQLADRLTAVAGSCGPGSLHFINGIFEANRNRAPVILIASQIIRDELGFDFIQEVDFKQVYRDCSVLCDMIHTPEQARRKTVIACQTALAKRGVAVLIVPADISASSVDDKIPYAVHVAGPSPGRTIPILMRSQRSSTRAKTSSCTVVQAARGRIRRFSRLPTG